MEAKTIVILILTIFTNFGKVLGEIHLKNDTNGDQHVAKFIGELVRDANSKDSTRVHDVAFLRSEDKASDDLFEAVLMEIPIENGLILPATNQYVKNQRIRVASFIIIISDTPEPVRTDSK